MALNIKHLTENKKEKKKLVLLTYEEDWNIGETMATFSKYVSGSNKNITCFVTFRISEICTFFPAESDKP